MLARDNPFATEHILRLRYRPQSLSWESIHERLVAMHYRAALVGPEGSGKTTLLEDLEPHLEASGFETSWLRLNLQDRQIPAEFWRSQFSPQHILLVDGAEVLSRPTWWRLKHLTRASGLIVTAHRPGLLPTLLRTETSPQLLRDLVATLDQPLSLDEAERLHRACQGNIREALRRLYLQTANNPYSSP